jgi:uncharacterized protein YaeQ
MALKPTIYKFKIALSDLNNEHYDALNLTVAQHPSETAQRMMARVMAFCLHAHANDENLMTFTKGLSSADEPDIWLRGLDDQLHLWIDIGEPSFDRVKKACRLAKQTYIYTFNSKSDVWWKQSHAQFSALPLQVVKFEWAQIQTLSQDLTRTMDFSITLSGETAYIALANTEVEVNWHVLQAL